ncbi:hypothetical protein [Variovorax sp. GB1P17]|uniref:hypothetical protein n=1 Tax=Variovorax sp. GB1P17 TaxID=3443740 RepID=UPI003F476E2F
MLQRLSRECKSDVLPNQPAVPHFTVGRVGRTPTLADPEYADALEDFRRKVTSSPDAARAFLRKVGIADEHGRLTKTYGG